MFKKIITTTIIYVKCTISLVRPIPLAGGLAIIMRLRLPFWVFSVHEPRVRDCRWVSTSKNPSPQSHAADRRSERHTSFYDGRSLTDDGRGEKNSPGCGRNRGGCALPGPASGFSRRECVTVFGGESGHPGKRKERFPIRSSTGCHERCTPHFAC